MFMMLFPNNNCTIFACRFKVIVFQIQLQEVIHSQRKQSDGETDCGRKAIRRCDFNLELKVHNDFEDLTNKQRKGISDCGCFGTFPREGCLTAFSFRFD